MRRAGSRAGSAGEGSRAREGAGSPSGCRKRAEAQLGGFGLWQQAGHTQGFALDKGLVAPQ